jgi:hypothetical protein
VAQLFSLGGMTTMNMKHIGEQIVRGLSAGCIVVILVQLYFWLTFRSRHPIEIDKLYAATVETLFICGLTLLVASLAMSGSSPKLAARGVIIAVLTILAAIFTPLNVVRA